jgi:hypothetical protein
VRALLATGRATTVATPAIAEFARSLRCIDEFPLLISDVLDTRTY